jgi:hypothetical protein
MSTTLGGQSSRGGAAPSRGRDPGWRGRGRGRGTGRGGGPSGGPIPVQKREEDWQELDYSSRSTEAPKVQATPLPGTAAKQPIPTGQKQQHGPPQPQNPPGTGKKSKKKKNKNIQAAAEVREGASEGKPPHAPHAAGSKKPPRTLNIGHLGLSTAQSGLAIPRDCPTPLSNGPDVSTGPHITDGNRPIGNSSSQSNAPPTGQVEPLSGNQMDRAARISTLSKNLKDHEALSYHTRKSLEALSNTRLRELFTLVTGKVFPPKASVAETARQRRDARLYGSPSMATHAVEYARRQPDFAGTSRRSLDHSTQQPPLPSQEGSGPGPKGSARENVTQIASSRAVSSAIDSNSKSALPSLT